MLNESKWPKYLRISQVHKKENKGSSCLLTEKSNWLWCFLKRKNNDDKFLFFSFILINNNISWFHIKDMIVKVVADDTITRKKKEVMWMKSLFSWFLIGFVRHDCFFTECLKYSDFKCITTFEFSSNFLT